MADVKLLVSRDQIENLIELIDLTEATTGITSEEVSLREWLSSHARYKPRTHGKRQRSQP